jgi:hypothetical protein
MKRSAGIAALVAAAVLATACSSGGSLADNKTTTTNAATTAASSASTATTAAPASTTTTAPKPKNVEVHPMFVQGSGANASGGVGKQVVSISDSTDKTLRLDFSEDEVQGFGDQTRAASWGAVTVATLLTGAKLEGNYRFEVSGAIDGPSAGALTTVAVLSLLRGDTIATDITMTGTINPDGTVGPVGGIPEKIVGTAKAGYKRILIPAGQRNSESEATGSLVDVVDLGKRNGATVTEVNDIYEAYKAFTGKDLPRLQGTGDVRLDDTAYTRIKAKADSALASFQQAAGRYNALDPAIQGLDEFSALAQEASDLADRARNLETQGLQAGAFQSASQANVLAAALTSAGEALQVYLTQGPDAFFSRVGSSQALQGQVFSLLDTLKTFTPKTVSDASGLMSAYANAFDALSVAQFGQNQIDAIVQGVRNGDMTTDDAVAALFEPVLYFEFAGGMVNLARDTFEIGRDLGGPAINKDINLTAIADFFRKGADANYAAFSTDVLKGLSDQSGLSQAEVTNRFAGLDTDVALSLNERAVLDTVKDYIGQGAPNAEYAALGYGISNYARNALLLTKYYSNGRLDEDFNLTGVRSEAALSGGLDLAKAQLAAGITKLRSSDIEPSIEVANYELAGVLREQDISSKFDALSDYWNGYLSSRVLAYLGGIQAIGS